MFYIKVSGEMWVEEEGNFNLLGTHTTEYFLKKVNKLVNTPHL